MNFVRRRFRFYLPLLMLVITALAGATYTPVHVTQAQGGGALGYGSNAYGTLSAEMPLAVYSFNGSAGDLVHIYASNWTGSLEPQIDLLTPSQQLLASTSDHPFAVQAQDAELSVFLPETGAYTLSVSGANGTTGEFVLQLMGRAAVPSTPLAFGQALPVTIPQDAGAQYFTFEAEDCPTTLVIQNDAPGQPFTFPFVAKVRNEKGTEIAQLRGGDALEDWVTVAPLSGQYEVEVLADDPTLTGSITLLVTCSGDVPGCPADGTGVLIPGAPVGGCPRCPGEPVTPDPVVCADFRVSIDANDDGLVTFSWPLVEGAEGAIWQLSHEDGAHAERLVEGVTSDTVNLRDLADSGAFRLVVHAWSAADGYICTAEVTIELEGPPTEPEPDPDGPGQVVPFACSIRLESPREGMANGLQTFFWSPVEGATGYRLRIYNEGSALVAEGTVAAPATSMTLDVSTAAIGHGFTFTVAIEALRSGEHWCVDAVTQMREHREDGGGEPQPGCYFLNVVVDPPNMGSIAISPSPNCGNGYNPGTVITATASGKLQSWSGCGVSGSANPITFTLNSSCTLTGHF